MTTPTVGDPVPAGELAGRHRWADLLHNPESAVRGYIHDWVTVLGVCGHWWQCENTPDLWLRLAGENCPECGRPPSHALHGRVIYPEACRERALPWKGEHS